VAVFIGKGVLIEVEWLDFYDNFMEFHHWFGDILF
jgi:hypothetical protein